MTTEAPRQKVGTGFWHQRCAPRRFKRIVAAILAAALPLTSLHADVGSSMDSFLSDVGGAANVNGPTAFQGQSAGYYSLGNVWTRFPQKTTNLANLQLPRARAGCGGIDLFAGSFSFINASEIVAMLKAVANNAVGFAFSLAIDTVCPECSKIMQEFAQKAQLMNNLNINSCELAQGLVGGIWPKGDLADKAICEAIGNSEGIFTDYAAAKHGCGTRGQRRQIRRRQSGRGAQLHLDHPQEVGVLLARRQPRPGARRICDDPAWHDHLRAAQGRRAGQVRADRR
jgi:conjugative transfer pilus assembly protein TraH